MYLFTNGKSSETSIITVFVPSCGIVGPDEGVCEAGVEADDGVDEGVADVMDPGKDDVNLGMEGIGVVETPSDVSRITLEWV